MKELRIELLDPRLGLPICKKPAGIKVSGLTTAPQNGPMGEAVFHLTAFVEGVAASAVANFLCNYIVQYRAKRVRINDREPVDEADFKRIVCEELEIGKND